MYLVTTAIHTIILMFKLRGDEIKQVNFLPVISNF
jgi:hypothetical protein